MTSKGNEISDSDDDSKSETIYGSQAPSEIYGKFEAQKKPGFEIIPETIVEEILVVFSRSKNIHSLPDFQEILMKLQREFVTMRQTEPEKDTLRIPQHIEKDMIDMLTEQNTTNEFSEKIFDTGNKRKAHMTIGDQKRQSKYTIPGIKISEDSTRQLSSKKLEDIRSIRRLFVDPINSALAVLGPLENCLSYFIKRRAPSIHPNEFIVDLYYNCTNLPYHIHIQAVLQKEAKMYNVIGYSYDVFQVKNWQFNDLVENSKVYSVAKKAGNGFSRHIIEVPCTVPEKCITDEQPVENLDAIQHGNRHFYTYTNPESRKPSFEERK